MTTQLSDNREFESTSVSEADANFARIAWLEINIKSKQAKAEKRVADIKAKLDAETCDNIDEFNELAKWLDKYILANKERFQKPRMRVTEYGKYGLGKATKLTIKDEVEVITFADEKDLPLYSVTKKVDKKAVAKAICDGEDIPGCKIVSGDISKFNVDKKLLDAAIKK